MSIGCGVILKFSEARGREDFNVSNLWDLECADSCSQQEVEKARKTTVPV